MSFNTEDEENLTEEVIRNAYLHTHTHRVDNYIENIASYWKYMSFISNLARPFLLSEIITMFSFHCGKLSFFPLVYININRLFMKSD